MISIQENAFHKCHLQSFDQFGKASSFISILLDDVIKWKHFLRYWPFVLGIHRSVVNSPHKGQWRGALMFSLICAWINGWVNNRESGDLRRHRSYYDVIVMDMFWIPGHGSCGVQRPRYRISGSGGVLSTGNTWHPDYRYRCRHRTARRKGLLLMWIKMQIFK